MANFPDSPVLPPARPVRFTALLYGVVFGLILLAAATFFLPIEWKEAKLRFKLWQAGARPVLWEKHRGFTVDRCQGKAPADCECVWLIHGMGDSVTTWKNVFLTPDVFGDQPVRVYAIDLPGHGGSLKRRDPSEYRASNMARELAAGIFATPECKRNALVGNSFGGWVATRMVLQNPERFARLVLISPSGTMASELATKDLLEQASVASLKEFQRRAYFKPRELSDAEWAKAALRLKDGNISEVRSAQVPEDRLGGNLAMVGLGTFLIRGDADQIITREVMDVFAKALRRHELATIPECGHLPQKECPDRLFPLLRRALTMKFQGE